MCPEQGVAIRQREPEAIFRHAQRHRIVQDAAVGVGDERVGGLPDLQLGKVAWRQQLGETQCVRPAHLQLAFAGHVPKLHRPHRPPVILPGRLGVGHRQIHVVIDGEGAGAVAQGGQVEGRLPHPRPEGDARLVVSHVCRRVAEGAAV